MTRKDYIKLCHALASGIATDNVVTSLCAWLQDDNPRFNRNKFEAYLTKLVNAYEKERDKHA